MKGLSERTTVELGAVAFGLVSIISVTVWITSVANLSEASAAKLMSVEAAFASELEENRKMSSQVLERLTRIETKLEGIEARMKQKE